MIIWYLNQEKRLKISLIEYIKELRNSRSRNLYIIFIKLSDSFDSIICLAGGFEMGSVKDKDIFEKYEKLDKMNL